MDTIKNTLKTCESNKPDRIFSKNPHVVGFNYLSNGSS